MKKNKISVFVIFNLCFYLLLVSGCESLQRKFTRINKNKASKETMILTPRDYSAHPFPPDVLYKQYFIYWRAWNQELITSLNDLAPYKKVKDCMGETLSNLLKMSTYLNEEKAKELGVYLKKAQDLSLRIEDAKTVPPLQKKDLRYDAERLLSNVNRKFDLTKMKPYLKQDFKNENL
jgi:dsDNA-binding SOS-regulon protein